MYKRQAIADDVKPEPSWQKLGGGRDSVLHSPERLGSDPILHGNSGGECCHTDRPQRRELGFNRLVALQDDQADPGSGSETLVDREWQSLQVGLQCSPSSCACCSKNDAPEGISATAIS